jgi:hypothetical protein
VRNRFASKIAGPLAGWKLESRVLDYGMSTEEILRTIKPKTIREEKIITAIRRNQLSEVKENLFFLADGVVRVCFREKKAGWLIEFYNNINYADLMVWNTGDLVFSTKFANL